MVCSRLVSILVLEAAAGFAPKTRVMRASYVGTMIGDVGFDPLRLAEVQVDLSYARGAEIKHGRIAMLATVGFLVQEYVHLPGEAYQNSQPLKAPWTVPWAANLQILLLAGCVELATADKTYGDTPWDLGFDPLCFQEGKSQAELDDLALKELTNGRLAMMAFVGMTIQTLLFDKPLLSV
ncbi:putative plastid light harvesting protein isoform 8 [Aureococcus anophagefferens]|uniref:Putative plastid light harvesting protein isoform 8 n=1 Tax=Aureococcus anophagefferens TaxID=44056 RepID=F0Y094_AURAN|nr:putative plastid light harvesting protein isoform 8 [Aureococcus anophagefferens]EGB11488.1 putative plastid light harvesting protein isoform 8 [Aureococcus anophagefferens]|eukprot:XP_009033850.1 putative plastid light harvesting protein isoform 8 [Aureococcus anophagefferens]